MAPRRLSRVSDPSSSKRVTIEEEEEEDNGQPNEEQEREMTLKDRQDAMNKSHPFGLPIWKPALYKKSRSVVRRANLALHSSPSSAPELFLNPGNLIWLLMFGWWLSLVISIIALVMLIVPCGGARYSCVLRELAFYLLWPFGRYVERQVEISPSQVYHHQGNENAPLLKPSSPRKSLLSSFIDTLKLGPAACIYYILFYTLIAPILLLVSTICWLCVVSIPMAKLNYILVRHLRRHPLTLRFKSSPSGLIAPTNGSQPTVILLCTYQAIGLQYYKYTFDGVNIMFINLMPLVFFVIIDDWYLKISSPTIVFTLSLAAVIPLSYFIGMGVSSISAQSSMGVGATINATFGSIIEIILYGVALVSGKSGLVEGALIGSFLAGVLLMPGCSMVSGAIKRKEQRFNSKSAGVTATMLIMSIIGALAPTLFYQMFGSFELKCIGCPENTMVNGTLACSRCYYDQLNPTEDPVYQNNVKPLMWLCAAILPSAYIVGLVFSLHTHADMVWKSQHHDKDHVSYYQRLMPSHIISQLLHHQPRKTEDNNIQYNAIVAVPKQPPSNGYIYEDGEEEEEEGAGHDSPNWGKIKSFIILFGCTLLYSIIAEVLVDTVDEVMKDSPLDEKFLGLTLFALVPNITEFMNAISFALYGNIVLSMEIGSAYALQVCLLQIPAMVGFSVWYNYGKEELAKFTFSLVFPRWDVISVIFSVFLLTYTYQEGKANYFKGSILILSYVVLIAGFYFVPHSFSEHGVLVEFPSA